MPTTELTAPPVLEKLRGLRPSSPLLSARVPCQSPGQEPGTSDEAAEVPDVAAGIAAVEADVVD